MNLSNLEFSYIILIINTHLNLNQSFVFLVFISWQILPKLIIRFQRELLLSDANVINSNKRTH